jgi:hypothetical protein
MEDHDLADLFPPDSNGQVTMTREPAIQQPTIAPVMPDITQHYATVIQHLGIEVANHVITEATLQAKVALVLQSYAALKIDTWIRQVAHQPSLANRDEMTTISGPVVIPFEEHEALSRFLAAVEALR